MDTTSSSVSRQELETTRQRITHVIQGAGAGAGQVLPPADPSYTMGFDGDATLLGPMLETSSEFFEFSDEIRRAIGALRDTGIEPLNLGGDTDGQLM